MNRKRVIIKRLHPGARIPDYAYDTDSGADVFSLKPEVIPAKTLRKIPTGLAVELPYGYELQVRSKSGLAAKNAVFVLNSPGTIDTDYRDEICVLLYNLSDNDYHVQAGQKIAQLVLAPVFHADYAELERGGGFGSTGLFAIPQPVAEPAPVLPFKKPQSKGYWVNTDDNDQGFLNGTLGLE